MRIIFLSLAMLVVSYLPAFATTNPAKQYEMMRGTEPPVDGPWDAYDRKGNLVRKENYKNYRLDGEVKDIYPSGQVRAISYYTDGTRVGPYKQFYENGTLELEATYVNNNFEGESSHYYNTGELESQSHYAAGNLDGDKRIYYKDGVLKQILNYERGLIEGTALTYSEDGQIIVEESYAQGALTSRKAYDSGVGIAVAKPADKPAVVTPPPPAMKAADAATANPLPAKTNTEAPGITGDKK